MLSDCWWIRTVLHVHDLVIIYTRSVCFQLPQNQDHVVQESKLHSINFNIYTDLGVLITWIKKPVDNGMQSDKFVFGFYRVVFFIFI